MQEWQYHPAADLNCTLVERLKQFPREPDLLCYALRSGAALALRAWLKLYHRFEVVGGHNLPAEGSFVLVSNHSSHLDALCLLSALPLSKLHRAFPAAAADYFFQSLPRVAAAAVLVNALPFHREYHIRQTLRVCRELLANPGNVLILFPEGTRGKTDHVAPFKPGIGSLVAGTDIPVVPCYLDGARESLPKGAWLPRPRRLRLHVGPPRVFQKASTDRESILAVSAELHDAVVSLKPGQASTASQAVHDLPCTP